MATRRNATKLSLWLCSAALACLSPLHAAAEENALAQADQPPHLDGALEVDEPEPRHRALAAGAAIVPGLLVHGSGNFVLGRKQTALRLLILQGVGLGLLGLGGGVLFATGAARDFTGPAIITAVAGGGFFLSSALADLYSVLSPRGGTGIDPGWVPILEAELGYRHVYDPQFAYRHFIVSGLHGRYERWRLSPSLWSSPDNANQRVRVEFAHRFFGPLPGTARTDGNFLEAEVAFTDHRFGFEDIALTTLEGSLKGRWDFATYDPHLAGSFFDFAVGLANQLYDFGPTVPGDSSFRLLLARVGFGVYLGDQSPTGGFVRAYYDHRHDGFAGGLLLPGVGSGALGHFGAEAVYYLARTWGLRAEAQVGAATIIGLSGLFRYGGER